MQQSYRRAATRKCNFNKVAKLDFNRGGRLLLTFHINIRGGSRTAATSKMEHFVIIVSGWKPLTVTTKTSILGVAAVLVSPLNV